MLKVVRRSFHATAAHHGCTGQVVYGRGIKVPWAHPTAVAARAREHNPRIQEVVPQPVARQVFIPSFDALIVRPHVDTAYACPEVVLWDGRVTIRDVDWIGCLHRVIGPLTRDECTRLACWTEEDHSHATMALKPSHNFFDHLGITSDKLIDTLVDAEPFAVSIERSPKMRCIAAKDLHGWYVFCLA